MKRTLKFILGLAVLASIIIETAWAQCPSGRCCRGGNCPAGVQAYWTPFGWQYYRTAKAKPAEQEDQGENPSIEKVVPETPLPPEFEEKTASKVEIKPLCLRVIELINEQRKSAGLPALLPDETLSVGCDSHSNYMRSYGFGHAQNGGRECIAMGVMTPESVVRLWLNSSGHRAILLGGGRIIGVGVSGSFWTLRIR